MTVCKLLSELRTKVDNSPSIFVFKLRTLNLSDILNNTRYFKLKLLHKYLSVMKNYSIFPSRQKRLFQPGFIPDLAIPFLATFCCNSTLFVHDNEGSNYLLCLGWQRNDDHILCCRWCTFSLMQGIYTDRRLSDVKYDWTAKRKEIQWSSPVASLTVHTNHMTQIKGS